MAIIRKAWTTAEVSLLKETVEDYISKGKRLREAADDLTDVLDRTSDAIVTKYNEILRDAKKPASDSKPLRGLEELLQHFRELQSENSKLRAEVAELKQQQRDYEDLSRLLIKAREQFINKNGESKYITDSSGVVEKIS